MRNLRLTYGSRRAAPGTSGQDAFFKSRQEYSLAHKTAKGWQYKGYLDEQFCQVEDLQDEASPNFAEEVITLFFKDSARLISNIEQALEKYPKDFNKWDAYMQQLKGSCSSIGASRMKSECMSFREFCGQGNVEGCMKSFQKVKREHGVLRQKLEAYFQLLRQAGPAGAATRPGM
nr:unnamed protein product [Digitaria exilis]